MSVPMYCMVTRLKSLFLWIAASWGEGLTMSLRVSCHCLIFAILLLCYPWIGVLGRFPQRLWPGALPGTRVSVLAAVLKVLYMYIRSKAAETGVRFILHKYRACHHGFLFRHY